MTIIFFTLCFLALVALIDYVIFALDEPKTKDFTYLEKFKKKMDKKKKDKDYGDES